MPFTCNASHQGLALSTTPVTLGMPYESSHMLIRKAAQRCAKFRQNLWPYSRGMS